MKMERAQEIAEVIGGAPYELEDGSWMVLIKRKDGRLIVVSDQTVEEYADHDAFRLGRCYSCISLS